MNDTGSEASILQPKQAMAACAIPAALALLCYLRTLGYGFVWDDAQIFFSDPGVFADWASIWRWATAPFLDFGMYFRPLALLDLAMEFRTSGGDPVLLHAVNIGLHAANAAMVAALAMNLAAARAHAPRSRMAAGLAAGAFYAAHPALVEGVSWISARFDLLTAFFGLAALLADRLLHRVSSRALAGSLLFLCAALCKEMILGLALALPLWHLLLARPGQGMSSVLRDNAVVYAAYAGAGLLYLLLRAYCLPDLLHLPAASGMAERLPLIGKTLGRYLQLALWPNTLSSPIHPLLVAPSHADRECLFGLAAAVAAGAAAMTRGLARDLGLLAACFLLALLPVAHVLPMVIGDSFAAERYLQLPLAFVALATGLLAAQTLAQGQRSFRLALFALGAGWLVLAALALAKNGAAWKSNEPLWLHAYARAPSSELVTTNVMEILFQRGEIEAGLAVAEQCRQRQGGQLTARQQLKQARLLGAAGRYDEALKIMREAAPGIDADSRTAQFGLHQVWGLIGMEAGELELAAAQFELARQILPNVADTSYNEGLALMALGRTAEGRARLDSAYASGAAEVAGWRSNETRNIEVAVTKARQRAARAASE